MGVSAEVGWMEMQRGASYLPFLSFHYAAGKLSLRGKCRAEPRIGNDDGGGPVPENLHLAWGSQ